MPPLTRRSSPIDLSRSSSNASINEIDSPTTPPGGVSVVEAPVAAFVRTLFSLVNGPYESTLVEWSPDGTKIVIRDPPRFAAEVCPKFYRHSNWNSFTRVVNMSVAGVTGDSSGRGSRGSDFGRRCA
jgi:transglutaminase-like putative cysteine protease